MWTIKRSLFAFFVAAVIIFGGPLIWPTHETTNAQTAPAPQVQQNGNCNNAGTFNGPVNQDCQTINNGPAPDPNGIYQSGIKIGVGHDPSINLQNKTISFVAMAFTAYSDPTKPLEFQAYLIQCKGAPVANPNEFVGSFSVALLGGKCKIVGNR